MISLKVAGSVPFHLYFFPQVALDMIVKC